VRVVGGVWAGARRPSLIGIGWMVCQYSRLGQVSSEKHDIAPDAGADGRGGGISGVCSAMVVMGS
jgi:hypothetical protein